jgi:hypothetical protein
MERHQFTCTVGTNGSFGKMESADYLYCDKSEGKITQQRWQAALILVDGKVSAVSVTTGLVGP